MRSTVTYSHTRTCARTFYTRSQAIRTCVCNIYSYFVCRLFIVFAGTTGVFHGHYPCKGRVRTHGRWIQSPASQKHIRADEFDGLHAHARCMRDCCSLLSNVQKSRDYNYAVSVVVRHILLLHPTNGMQPIKMCLLCCCFFVPRSLRLFWWYTE